MPSFSVFPFPDRYVLHGCPDHSAGSDTLLPAAPPTGLYPQIAAKVSLTASDSDSLTESQSKSRSYVTVRTSDGSEKALLITEYMPDIRGVAIVCRGGENEQTAERIKGAVTAALDITSKRVYITGGK